MMTDQKQSQRNCVYGPAPSRRLGQSLGVDLVPYKTCTYDCIYCQLDRTTHKTTERSEWLSPEEIVTEIREIVIAGQQGDLRVLSYFIEKDKNVYLFHGFTNAGNFGKYRSTFKNTMSNFDRLRNRKARNVKPTRIKVVKVSRKTTLKDLLARHPSEEVTPEKLAIVNGMQLTDELKPGDRVKILTK